MTESICARCGRVIYRVTSSDGIMGFWWTQAERDRNVKEMQKEWEGGQCNHKPKDDIDPEVKQETPPPTAKKPDSRMTMLKKNPEYEYLSMRFALHTKEMIKGMIDKKIARDWVEAIDIMAHFCHMATTHIMQVSPEIKKETDK